jgi:hypothetical protein
MVSSMRGLDFSMLESSTAGMRGRMDAEELELDKEHPTSFALAPVKDVRLSTSMVHECCESRRLDPTFRL